MDDYPRTRISEETFRRLVPTGDIGLAEMTLLLHYDLDFLLDIYTRAYDANERFFLKMDGAWRRLCEADACFERDFFGIKTLVGGWPVLPDLTFSGPPHGRRRVPLPAAVKGLFKADQDRARAEEIHNARVVAIFTARAVRGAYVDYDFIVSHISRIPRDVIESLLHDQPSEFADAIAVYVNDITLYEWGRLIRALESTSKELSEWPDIRPSWNVADIADRMRRVYRQAQELVFERAAHTIMTAFRASSAVLERGIESKFDWIVARLIGSAVVPKPSKAYRWAEIVYVPRSPPDFDALAAHRREQLVNQDDLAFDATLPAYTQDERTNGAFMYAEHDAFVAHRRAERARAETERARIAAEEAQAVFRAAAEARLRK